MKARPAWWKQVEVALGLTPAIVVGSDCGAEIAVDVMRRYPGLIRGAVLSQPWLNSLDPAGAEEFWAPVLATVRSAPTLRAAVDAFFTATGGEWWGRLPEIRREAARSNHAALRATLIMPQYLMASADLGAISIPIRLITATRTSPFHERTAALIAERTPIVDLIQLEGAGHFPFFDQPRAFSDAVRSFARKLTGALV